MSQALQALRDAVGDGRESAAVLAVLEELHPAGARRKGKKTTPADAGDGAQGATEQEK